MFVELYLESIELLSLTDGDITFDVATGSFQQIGRCLQTINLLQTNGCLPSTGTFLFLRFTLTDVLVKSLYVLSVFCHILITCWRN